MSGEINNISVAQVLESDASVWKNTATQAPGPQGSLPITAQMLRTEHSGNLFGLTQNAGMGWEPTRLQDPEFLILSTHGGVRSPDGTPIALGFHTGHWEVGLLVAEAARELREHQFLSPEHAQIPATDAHRARWECSTRCRTGTMLP